MPKFDILYYQTRVWCFRKLLNVNLCILNTQKNIVNFLFKSENRVNRIRELERTLDSERLILNYWKYKKDS